MPTILIPYWFLIDFFLFSVGIQNNPFLRWGGQNRNLQEIQIPLQNSTEFFDNDEGFHLVNLTEVMRNLSEFRLLVRAHIVDSKGCFGRESNFTYRGEINLNNTQILNYLNNTQILTQEPIYIEISHISYLYPKTSKIPNITCDIE